MKKFVFIYFGSDVTKEAKQEEINASRDKWMAWFGTFQDRMIDGGNPFPPGGKSVNANGVKDVDTKPATGYTIINAKDIDEATQIAKGCPLTEKDGAVQVYEAMPM